MEKIFIVGAGLMGGGIALVSAKAGYDVIVAERSEEDLQRGQNMIQKTLASLIKKGKWSEEEAAQSLDRIKGTTTLEDGRTADLVIEAVPEKLEIKQAVFRELDRIARPDAILASNTSSLSIAAIGSVTRRPEKVVGMHFFSPVPVMDLLEIVRSMRTSEETMQQVLAVGKQLGKKTIVAKDYPGFTVNRVLVPMLNEAAYLVMEGNDPEDVDHGMMLGANHPVGPLRLADYVGIDVLLFTLESLYDGFNDSKYRPCPLLKRMVEAGMLGKKTGQGFYSYS
jgi:3-hydroxybutyryl-CoA dehydrogenase